MDGPLSMLSIWSKNIWLFTKIGDYMLSTCAIHSIAFDEEHDIDSDTTEEVSSLIYDFDLVSLFDKNPVD